MKTAFITGITGQDGSYLAKFLLEKEYKVIGLKRRTSLICTDRIDQFYNHENFKLEYFELNDIGSIYRLLLEYKPDEFYNLAAQSHVGASFTSPESTFQINATGVLNCLEAIKTLKPNTKFYQASTSEMFGRNYVEHAGKKYQNENTTMLPQSPYGIAKLASHHMVQIYRSAYGIFACSGILFNHESPVRGETFVTRKITRAVAKIYHGLNDKLCDFLGIVKPNNFYDDKKANSYDKHKKILNICDISNGLLKDKFLMQSANSNGPLISNLRSMMKLFCERARVFLDVLYKGLPKVSALSVSRPSPFH